VREGEDQEVKDSLGQADQGRGPQPEKTAGVPDSTAVVAEALAGQQRADP